MSAPLPPLRILLVENHQDTARYLKLFLEQQGHHVQTAADLASARPLLAAQVDLLLCDIVLPDGKGWELLAPGRGAPPRFAVAMSGYCSEADMARSRAAGFQHHLGKPFVPDDLLPLLDEAARARLS